MTLSLLYLLLPVQELQDEVFKLSRSEAQIRFHLRNEEDGGGFTNVEAQWCINA